MANSAAGAIENGLLSMNTTKNPLLAGFFVAAFIAAFCCRLLF
jgi:hypothetical protein